MIARKLLTLGLSGGVITALCCFTPILVWTLGALGLGALSAGLDAVLWPALLLFVGLTIYALIRRGRVAAARAQSR